jgi:hypothetical protein
MKYLLFTITLVGLLNESLKAQTKEETIQWLTDKLVSYGNVKHRIISQEDFLLWRSDYERYANQICRSSKIQNDSLQVHFDLYLLVGDNDVRHDNHGNFNLNWNDVVNFEITTGPNTFLILYTKDKIDKIFEVDYPNGNSPTVYGKVSFISIIINWNSEPNLKERITTALTKLIQFNKPKEAY